MSVDKTPASPSNEELEAISTTTIKHPWFTGLKAMADMFSEMVPFQERVRIVVDYDPQDTHTKIIIYRPKGDLSVEARALDRTDRSEPQYSQDQYRIVKLDDTAQIHLHPNPESAIHESHSRVQALMGSDGVSPCTVKKDIPPGPQNQP